MSTSIADKVTAKEGYTIAVALVCATEAIDRLLQDRDLEWLYRNRIEMEKLLLHGFDGRFLCDLTEFVLRDLFGEAAQPRENSSCCEATSEAGSAPTT
jgi:hypothetical protein